MEVIIHNQKIEAASVFLEKAISSSNDISGSVFLPTEPDVPGCVMNIDETFKLNDLKHKGSLIAFRIEGSKNSINERTQNLIEELEISDLDIFLSGFCKSIIRAPAGGITCFGTTKVSPNLLLNLSAISRVISIC